MQQIVKGAEQNVIWHRSFLAEPPILVLTRFHVRILAEKSLTTRLGLHRFHIFLYWLKNGTHDVLFRKRRWVLRVKHPQSPRV